jgi:ABC-2 type transport system permease protein
MAMILQILVPLVIFFIGFNTVAADRENGTLKILLGQGVSWTEILTGKILGLLGIALSILLLGIVLLVVTCLTIPQNQFTANDGLLIGWILLCYVLYFGIICMIAVVISAYSRTSKLALLSLISLWLLWAIILPRSMQAAGNFLYASPSRIEFEAAIEKDLIQKGDSHNPDDPYYKTLKDSVLKAHNVSSVEQLPFNYGGYQMKEGERISATIYNQHLFALLKRYEQQNDVSRLSAFVNPLLALRNISMGISGTGFNTYMQFQQQAEDYRYQLAQHMNDLQIKLISNKKLGDQDKPYSISREYWKSLPDFSYKVDSPAVMIAGETRSLFALVCWMLLLITTVVILSKELKAI